MASHQAPSSSAPAVQRSYANVARSSSAISSLLTGSNRVPLGTRKDRISVHKRISFPNVSVFPNPDSSTRSNSFNHPGSHPSPVFIQRCPRCLSTGHRRAACRRPIQCYACYAPGHVAASCSGAGIKAHKVAATKDRENFNPSKNLGKVDISKGKAVLTMANNWFGKTSGSGPSKPPVFNSYGEWWKAQSPSWVEINLAPSSTVPWVPRLLTMDPPAHKMAETLPCLEPSSWSLGTPSHSPGVPSTNSNQRNLATGLLLFSPAAGRISWRTSDVIQGHLCQGTCHGMML